MKRSWLLLSILLILSGSVSRGQSFDWNLRGGLNLMNSKTSGEDLSLLYHFGGQAGLRIANFGFYGEALYSMHENQYGGDPVAYLIPAIVVKGFLRKIIFVEFGGALLTRSGSSDSTNDTLNPDGDPFMLAGMGAHISKVEISLRSVAKQSYGVIQATIALKF